MTENSKVLFVKPFIYQESVSALVLVPLIYFIFMNAIPGFRANLLEAAILASTTATVGFILGFLVKYILVKPAIEVMDNGTSRSGDLQGAVSSAAILPLAETVIVFLRWSLAAIIISVIPFYMRGHIDMNEAAFGINALVMTAFPLCHLPILHRKAACSHSICRVTSRGFWTVKSGCSA